MEPFSLSPKILEPVQLEQLLYLLHTGYATEWVLNCCIDVCRNCSRVVSNSYGPAVDPVLRLNIRCDGSELSLGDCSFSDWDDTDEVTAHRCGHSSSHVAVQCRQCHVTSAGRSRRTSSSTTYNDSNSDSGTLRCRSVTVFYKGRNPLGEGELVGN